MFRYDIHSVLFKKQFYLPKKSPFYTFDSILQVESLYSRLYFSLYRALCIIKKYSVRDRNKYEVTWNTNCR